MTVVQPLSAVSSCSWIWGQVISSPPFETCHLMTTYRRALCRRKEENILGEHSLRWLENRGGGIWVVLNVSGLHRCIYYILCLNRRTLDTLYKGLPNVQILFGSFFVFYGSMWLGVQMISISPRHYFLPNRTVVNLNFHLYERSVYPVLYAFRPGGLGIPLVSCPHLGLMSSVLILVFPSPALSSISPPLHLIMKSENDIGRFLWYFIPTNSMAMQIKKKSLQRGFWRFKKPTKVCSH